MTFDQLRQETGVPVVIADNEGRITEVNKSFEKVFGWSAQEIQGKTLATLIPTELRASHHMGFSRFLTTGTPTLLNKPLKLKAVSKTGEIFNAEHFIIAEQQQGRWIFGATIRPCP